MDASSSYCIAGCLLVQAVGWLAIEGVLGLLSTWITLGCPRARGPLAGKLPRVIEVTVVDSIKISGCIELVAVVCPVLAELVGRRSTSRVRSSAHWLHITFRLGGSLVRFVDFAWGSY